MQITIYLKKASIKTQGANQTLSAHAFEMCRMTTHITLYFMCRT